MDKATQQFIYIDNKIVLQSSLCCSLERKKNNAQPWKIWRSAYIPTLLRRETARLGLTAQFPHIGWKHLSTLKCTMRLWGCISTAGALQSQFAEGHGYVVPHRFKTLTRNHDLQHLESRYFGYLRIIMRNSQVSMSGLECKLVITMLKQRFHCPCASNLQWRLLRSTHIEGPGLQVPSLLWFCFRRCIIYVS